MIGRRRGRVGGGLIAGLLALGLAVEIVGAPSAAHLADLGAVAALAVADRACRVVLAAGEVLPAAKVAASSLEPTFRPFESQPSPVCFQPTQASLVEQPLTVPRYSQVQLLKKQLPLSPSSPVHSTPPLPPEHPALHVLESAAATLRQAARAAIFMVSVPITGEARLSTRAKQTGES